MADMHEVTFLWPEVDAENVIITGTFDQWSSSVQLTKTPRGFEGKVKLRWGDRVLYKFVVDGRWLTSQSQPIESDDSGNINNVYQCPPKREPSTAQATSFDHPSESAELTDGGDTDNPTVSVDFTTTHANGLLSETPSQQNENAIGDEDHIPPLEANPLSNAEALEKDNILTDTAQRQAEAAHSQKEHLPPGISPTNGPTAVLDAEIEGVAEPTYERTDSDSQPTLSQELGAESRNADKAFITNESTPAATAAEIIQTSAETHVAGFSVHTAQDVVVVDQTPATDISANVPANGEPATNDGANVAVNEVLAADTTIEAPGNEELATNATFKVPAKEEPATKASVVVPAGEVPDTGTATDVPAINPALDVPTEDVSATDDAVKDVPFTAMPGAEQPASQAIDEDGKDAPANETPAEVALINEVPVEKAPMEDAAAEPVPIERGPAEDVLIERGPTEDASIEKASAEDAPANESLVQEAPKEEATAELAPIVDGPAEDVPIEGAPTEDASTEKTPAGDAPVKEPLAQEAPKEETIVELAPIVDVPAENVPIEGAPTEAASTEKASAGDAPVKEPLAEEIPIVGGPAENVPIEGTPTEDASTEKSSARDAPANESLVQEALKEEATAELTPMIDGPAEDVPIEGAPTEDASTEKTPAGDAPAKEPLVQEAPKEDTTVELAHIVGGPAENVPIEGAPTEDASTEKASAGDAPVKEPLAEEALTEEATAELAPIVDGPVENVPIEGAPTEDASTEKASAGDKPANESLAQEAPKEEGTAELAPIVDGPAEDVPIEWAPAEDVSAKEPLAELAPIEGGSAEDLSTEKAPAGNAPVKEPHAQDAPAEEVSATDFSPKVEDAPGTDTSAQVPEEERPDTKASSIAPAEAKLVTNIVKAVPTTDVAAKDSAGTPAALKAPSGEVPAQEEQVTGAEVTITAEGLPISIPEEESAADTSVKKEFPINDVSVQSPTNEDTAVGASIEVLTNEESTLDASAETAKAHPELVTETQIKPSDEAQVADTAKEGLVADTTTTKEPVADSAKEELVADSTKMEPANVTESIQPVTDIANGKPATAAVKVFAEEEPATDGTMKLTAEPALGTTGTFAEQPAIDTSVQVSEGRTATETAVKLPPEIEQTKEISVVVPAVEESTTPSGDNIPESSAGLESTPNMKSTVPEIATMVDESLIKTAAAGATAAEIHKANSETVTSTNGTTKAEPPLEPASEVHPTSNSIEKAAEAFNGSQVVQTISEQPKSGKTHKRRSSLFGMVKKLFSSKKENI